MLKGAIKDAEALFDYPGKQYTVFKDLESMVMERSTPTVPDALSDNKLAKAFYGAFVMVLGPDQVGDLEDEFLTAEALHITDVVQNAMKVHSINPASLDAEIRKSLLPRMYNLPGGIEAAKAVIEQVIGIVSAWYRLRARDYFVRQIVPGERRPPCGGVD